MCCFLAYKHSECIKWALYSNWCLAPEFYWLHYACYGGSAGLELSWRRRSFLAASLHAFRRHVKVKLHRQSSNLRLDHPVLLTNLNTRVIMLILCCIHFMILRVVSCQGWEANGLRDRWHINKYAQYMSYLQEEWAGGLAKPVLKCD